MLPNQHLPQAPFFGGLIWWYQIRMAFLTPPKNWIHTVWNMEHNFGIYLSVNFMCGIRPPCRTAVCYQSVCHIVGELGSRAAWHYLIIHEGQVSSPPGKEPNIFIIFLCYIINMEQPYSYVLYKLSVYIEMLLRVMLKELEERRMMYIYI